MVKINKKLQGDISNLAFIIEKSYHKFPYLFVIFGEFVSNNLKWYVLSIYPCFRANDCIVCLFVLGFMDCQEASAPVNLRPANLIFHSVERHTKTILYPAKIPPRL